MAKKKKKRQKLVPIDGLGPKEIKDIRTALRRVWGWSRARRLTAQRCIRNKKWSYCEKCKKRSPHIKIDHIVPCGAVDGGYIRRLFVSSQGLQGLCNECHNEKTRIERMKDF